MDTPDGIIMKRFVLFLAIPVVLFCVIGQAKATSLEHIINGGFETGDFTGWTVSSGGRWQINDGNFDPLVHCGPLPPISGSFDAMTYLLAGKNILFQQTTLPANIVSATLSWSDRIRNHAPDFRDPRQEWRVLIKDTSGNLIQEVFSTNPGDPTIQIGPNNRSFDLTSLAQSLAGQQIRISFEQQHIYFFNATLDDVSFITETSEIDIKPGSDPNSINLKAKGVLPVAILTTDDFDALSVDEDTVLFGDFELMGTAAPIRSSEEDVDDDGDIDLVLFFSIPDLVDDGALNEDSEEATLTGETLDGAPIIASDSVRIVPGSKKGNK